MTDQATTALQCPGRVPLNLLPDLPPEYKRRNPGLLDAHMQSFNPATNEVVLRLDAWQNLEFWAEPRFSLEQLAVFLREEAGIELQWKECVNMNYKTTPVILRLENGTTFNGKSVSVKDVNVSEYLK